MILVPKFRQVVELGGTLALAQYRDGKLIDSRFISNLVTTAGKKWIAARMKDAGSGQLQMSHMALGGSTTPGALAVTTPTVDETTLTTGSSYAERGRVALTTAGGSVSGAVVTYNATFNTSTAANCAIVEAGIFNAASGTYNETGHVNCMLCKTAFQVVNKGANDTIAITWTVTIQ